MVNSEQNSNTYIVGEGYYHLSHEDVQ